MCVANLTKSKVIQIEYTALICMKVSDIAYCAALRRLHLTDHARLNTNNSAFFRKLKTLNAQCQKV